MRNRVFVWNWKGDDKEETKKEREKAVCPPSGRDGELYNRVFSETLSDTRTNGYTLFNHFYYLLPYYTPHYHLISSRQLPFKDIK